MGEPIQERDLRVSDDERNHVIGVLQKATGRGLIDVDEFTTRSETALAARTRGELNAVVVDLPGLVNSSAPPSTRGSTLSGPMSTIKRSGAWTVPPELTVRNSLGATKLDFRDARIDYPQVRIHLDVSLGSVKLWLPKGTTVNTEELTVAMGSIGGRGISPAEPPGRRHFVIGGRIALGSLKMSRRR